MKLPRPISSYFSDWLAKQHGFGYIMLDSKGYVRSWGGGLDHLGIGPLEKGLPISEQLVFMEGLLPLTEPALHLPMVKPDTDHALDVHLFEIDGGYGLLFLDARMAAQNQAICQQKANESALLREQHIDSAEPVAAPLQAEPLENLFLACNMAALRLDPDGKYALIGRAPEWFSQFCPQAVIDSCRLDPDNFFAFLENFLHEAHIFWAQEKVGCIKSGLWIEHDEARKEHLFEATALFTGRSKILLITKEQSALIEKQALIQKGREYALGHHALERSQSELELARDVLELRVKERTRELEQINIRLEQELAHRKQLEIERNEMTLHLQQAQKMEAIGTLAGGIAHDFNNILAAVMGFTELSLADAPEGSRLETNLQHVFAAGLRAKKLISQILTFSRHSNPETRPVQLFMIINEAIGLLRASLPATIEIEQNLQSNAYVLADPSQLHQVVMNLCTNASQAMQPHGGVLRVALQEIEIVSKESSFYPDMPPGLYVQITISDSGYGMSKETLRRIYDPFFTTKEKGQGTGLGLSVVHGIVKNCKGDIAVTSKAGLGTTFRVILPTTTQLDSPVLRPQSGLATGDECVLFVDDEPMQADLAKKFLGPLGYRVVALTDSTVALHTFLNNPDQFDLVITDLYMPKMTGMILSAEIKRIRPDIPIIICSGYGDNAIDPTSIAQNIEGYLIKPFGMKDLASIIRKVLVGKNLSA